MASMKELFETVVQEQEWLIENLATYMDKPLSDSDETYTDAHGEFEEHCYELACELLSFVKSDGVPYCKDEHDLGAEIARRLLSVY